MTGGRRAATPLAPLERDVDHEAREVQPSLAELTKNWGMDLADWKKTPRPRAIHFNVIQPWKIARDGSISDVMFA